MGDYNNNTANNMENGQGSLNQPMTGAQGGSDTLNAWKEYQKNIKDVGEIKVEVLKGFLEGEDIKTLFLKMARITAILTKDEVFYNTVKDRLDKAPNTK